MHILRKKGIIFGKTRFSETSLIIRMLSEDGELVSLIFRGALRSKSGVSARLMPFALLEFVFYEKSQRSLYTASEVSVIEDMTDKFSDYNAQKRAAKFIKRATAILQPGQSIHEVFDIVLALLRKWEDISELPHESVWGGFLLKIMTFAGFAPAVSRCASCEGKVENLKSSLFSPSAGGWLCVDCPVPADAIDLPGHIRLAMEFLLANPFKNYGKLDISNEDGKSICEILEKFWAYHIGAGADYTKMKKR